MYLRPGDLYKQFDIESLEQSVDSVGRPKSEYVRKDVKILGALGEATTEQRMRWEQLQHPITHTIVGYGDPLAKPGDKLIMDGRVFLIAGVDAPGSIQVCTLYYVEERSDVK